MPKERTEEEILARTPLTLKLGGADYSVPVLPILKTREWRKRMIEVANEIGAMGVTLAGIGQAFIAFPEKLIDLVFAYCPDLPREKILETATEEEMVVAFSQIASVSFPFLRQLSLMKSLVAMNLSASVKSTSSSSSSTDSARIM